MAVPCLGCSVPRGQLHANLSLEFLFAEIEEGCGQSKPREKVMCGGEGKGVEVKPEGK